MARERAGTVKERTNAQGVTRYLAYVAGEYLGTFADESGALEANAHALADHQGTAPKTFGLLGEKYMDEQEDHARARGRGRVFKKDRSLWACHVATAAFYDRPIKTITPKMIQEHIGVTLKKRATKAVRVGPAGYRIVQTKRRVTRRTAEAMLSRVALFLDQAIIDGAIPAPNPARLCVLPPVAVSEDEGDLITHLSADEITALFALALLTPMQRAVFAVGIYGGLRVGEIWGLRWQDAVRLDGPRPQLQVRRSYDGPVKTKRSRRDVPMLPPLVAALKAYRATLTPAPISGLMFPIARSAGELGRDRCHRAGYTAGWKDKPERRTGALTVLHGVRHKAGIRAEVLFKHLRHSCACHLLQGTFGIRLELSEVSKWLGHSSTAVTERHYAAFAKDNLHQALERQAPQGHQVTNRSRPE